MGESENIAARSSALVADGKRLAAAAPDDVYPQGPLSEAPQASAAAGPTEHPSLAFLGVSDAAERVWHRLLTGRVAHMESLAEQLGSDDRGIGHAVDELVELGLARFSTEGLCALDPALAIETHLARAERRLAAQSEQVAMIRSMVPDLARVYRHGRMDGSDDLPWELVTPLDEIRRQVYAASERTVSDIRMLDPGNPIAGADLLAMKDSEASQYEALERGVRDRSLINDSQLDDPGVFAAWIEIHQRGGQVRTAPQVSTRMTIFDDDLAMIAVEATDPHVAIAIRSRSVIEVLTYLFDQTWSQAVPLFSLPDELGVPGGRPARVLELMMTGMKDERIARALGVGARTVRRDIAEMRTTLGVSSRTEIVAAAAKRGWL